MPSAPAAPGGALSSGVSLRQRSLAYGQRGWNAQPRGGSSGFGTSPATAVARLAGQREIRHRGEQHPRVRMLRRREQTARRRELDDASQVHHADAVGDVVNDGEVVRDEQIGEAELALQAAHQVQHLRLHRHVERGGRLVADEKRRLACASARAIEMRCRWPPENWCGYLAPSAPARPTCSKQRGDARLDVGRVLGQSLRLPVRDRARRRCRRRASAD